LASENLPLNFLLAIEDQMTSPTRKIAKGQETFIKGVTKNGDAFVKTFNKMGAGFRKFGTNMRTGLAGMGKTGALLNGALGGLMGGVRLASKAVSGLLGTVAKVGAGIAVATLGIASALAMAALKYKTMFFELHEVTTLNSRDLGMAKGVVESYTAAWGHTRDEVKAVVKAGLQLSVHLRKDVKSLKAWTGHTLTLSKVTGMAAGELGVLEQRVSTVYRLGWRGFRQFGLAMKFTADQTSISAQELSGFVDTFGMALANIPGLSQDQRIAMTKDMTHMTGALKDFGVNGKSVWDAYGRSMELITDDAHGMLTLLSGTLGESSQDLVKRFQDSPQEFVYALSDALKTLTSRDGNVRLMLESEFKRAFGLQSLDIRSLQGLNKTGIELKIKDIEQLAKEKKALEDVRSKMLDPLVTAWNNLKSKMLPLMAKFGEPILRALGKHLPPLMTKLSKWARKNAGEVFLSTMKSIRRMVNDVPWMTLGKSITGMWKGLRMVLLKLNLINRRDYDASALSDKSGMGKGAARTLLNMVAPDLKLGSGASGMMKDALAKSYSEGAQGQARGALSANLFQAASLIPTKGVTPGQLAAFLSDAANQKKLGLGGLGKAKLKDLERALTTGLLATAAKALTDEPGNVLTESAQLRALTAGRKALLAGLRYMKLGDPMRIKGKRQHQGLIGRVAGDVGLPGVVLDSLVGHESRWRDRGKDGKIHTSKAGAMGLTQIKPTGSKSLETTIKSMAKRAKYKGSLDIEDPEVQLRLGAGYLSVLSKQYGGDLAVALAAYNQGEGHVNPLYKRGLRGKDLLSALPTDHKKQGNVREKATRYAMSILADAVVPTNQKPGGTLRNLSPEMFAVIMDALKVLKEIRDNPTTVKVEGSTGLTSIHDAYLRKRGAR
jgi:hypothetical protein